MAGDRLPTTDFRIEGASVSFWLRVKPRAARERLSVGPSGEFLLEVHAPPSEGEANGACIRFLARALRLPQACVVILSGERSRRKRIRITGRSAEETVAEIRKLARHSRGPA